MAGHTERYIVMRSSPGVKGSPDWASIFAVHRLQDLRGGQVVSGRLLLHLNPESAEVKLALAQWPGSHEFSRGPHGWDLVLHRKVGPQRERWRLHVALFLLTLFSVVVAGSLLSDRQPIRFTALHLFGRWRLPLPTTVDYDALGAGLPFGLALLGVLALHEAGHYVAARYHHISVTPPYFIPFPPYLSIIGTLGAFIRLRSPVMNRRALLDVGVAGPVMSFVVSLPLLWWGLLHSRVVVSPPGVGSPYLVRFITEEIWLGSSLALSAMARAVIGFSGADAVLMLHPVAFAGWIGLFVTALNLLPISQLDGGHVLYAMLGRRQRPFAWLFFGVLIPLGFLWMGWWVWAALVFFLGRGRVGHPPVFNAEEGLDGARLGIGLAAAVVFALCFVPVPFRL